VSRLCKDAPVELAHVVERFVEGLKFVDASSGSAATNQRTGAVYLHGVPAMSEAEVSKQILEWWVENYPSDFSPSDAHDREVRYPGIPRARCDIVFSSLGIEAIRQEWAIEVKRIQFVGDNGKNNDFNVQKMLSPYLKDRSLIHDIERMREHPIAQRHAVIGYAFSYDFDTCREALVHHPGETLRISEIREVCKKNDPINGLINCTDVVNVADLQFRNANVVKQFVTQNFSGLWRHPCGGRGTVFAWEVKPV